MRVKLTYDIKYWWYDVLDDRGVDKPIKSYYIVIMEKYEKSINFQVYTR
jgi:hypothetical protein